MDQTEPQETVEEQPQKKVHSDTAEARAERKRRSRANYRQRFCDCSNPSINRSGACEKCARIEKEMEAYHGFVHHETTTRRLFLEANPGFDPSSEEVASGGAT